MERTDKSRMECSEKMRSPRKFVTVAMGVMLLVAAWAISLQADGRPEEPAPSVSFSSYERELSIAADNALTDIRLTDAPQTSQRVTSSRTDETLLLESVRFKEFVGRYWRGRETTLTKALQRLRDLRFSIERILRDEGIPVELIGIVLIESAAQETAESPRGARGLWQLMPATAQRYGLRVNGQVDDRLDPAKATYAAAHYLRDLHLRFGDWLLALAAYNAGEDTVQRAIERSGKAEFWTLSNNRQLPGETRAYVPAVLAAIQLLGHPGAWFADLQRDRQKVKSDVLYAFPSVEGDLTGLGAGMTAPTKSTQAARR